MGSGVDFAKLHDGHVGIDLGGVEPGVTEQLLDEADVGAVFKHVGGAGVAHQVAGARPADAGGLDNAPDPVADVSGAEPLAVAAKEQGAFTAGRIQQGPGLFEIFLQPVENALAHRNHAVFLPLSLAYREQAALLN